MDTKFNIEYESIDRFVKSEYIFSVVIHTMLVLAFIMFIMTCIYYYFASNKRNYNNNNQ